MRDPVGQLRSASSPKRDSVDRPRDPYPAWRAITSISRAIGIQPATQIPSISRDPYRPGARFRPSTATCVHPMRSLVHQPG
ncbi:hypothetical protein [Longimicrobium terrae]|uniref:Uncharacterized protein n=1 Tax=Longimicrobium terrae TaxID=1639882 RepID=A0A841GTT8_9BACT|nr:hypothetical protein [Longimicrobium terrae]MBB4634512.1 hypothetical protein [Longimicrobium terrae]MBB6068598.1 hypothetical protein [Longimicrobium terrae]NNC27784.1 hypothetical protein [Longimicrobium terrae]